MTDELTIWSSAAEQARLLRDRKISATELLAMYRQRIIRYNPRLNAIVIDCLDTADERAREIDRMPAHKRPAPLYGLPMTIKESIEVEGLPTTGGVVEEQGRVSSASAPQFRALFDAGMTLMGKTNISYGCADWQSDSPVYGRTSNPWNLDRSPGGSSGGSAAAVATAITPLELGTDIGGSVRIPAAFCGVYGLRPSETALPRYGDYPGSLLPNPSVVMSVFGPIARYADDLEFALDILAAPALGEEVGWRLELPSPRHERLESFRVAVLGDVSWLPLSGHVRQSQHLLVNTLERTGSHVAIVDPEDVLGDSWRHHLLYMRLVLAIMGSGLGSDEQRMLIATIGTNRPELAQAAHEALYGSVGDFISWHSDRERQRERFRRFFKQWDVLVTPITLGTAFEHVPYERVLTDLFNRTIEIDGAPVPYDLQLVPPALATLSGQPAVSFPTGLAEDGLPVGLQAIGPYLEDRTVIRFASLLAQHIGGFQAPPGYD